MYLFFDADVGRGVPEALHAVNLPNLTWLTKRYGTTKRVPDVQWLTDAGRNGWLCISCNTAILNVEEERETIQNENVGIVFFDSGQDQSDQMLRVILNRWKWLEAIDTQIERPFAYVLSVSGRYRGVPIAPLRRRRNRILFT